MTWRVYLTEARRRRGHQDQQDFVRTLVLWARQARRREWQQPAQRGLFNGPT
jgi:hypothetical protein